MSGVPVEVPLIASAQRFTVTLIGVTYGMSLHWSPTAACWVLDIADVNDAPLISGIPLITGADLLEQYAYLGIGGALYAQTDNQPTAVPTFDNLGTLSHLYFVPT